MARQEMTREERVKLEEDKAPEAAVPVRPVFIRIEEFPAYASGSVSEIKEAFAAYLLSWIQTDLQYRSTVLVFPGIGKLAGFFGCQTFDILYAFSALEASGFRMAPLGFDAPLLITVPDVAPRPRVQIHDFQPFFHPKNSHASGSAYLSSSNRDGPLACPC